MRVIRTAEEMTRALASPLDRTLENRLRTYKAIFDEYRDNTFEELGLFLIVQPFDRLEDLDAASGTELLSPGETCFQAEAIERHGTWTEVTLILSDDGYGVVVFVPDAVGVDPRILAACNCSQEER